MEHSKQTVTKTNPWLFSLKIGVYAGLIWGLIYILAYYLGFTKIIPAFLAEPFFRHDYLASWRGHFIGWFSMIIFSVFTAFLYTAILKKAKGPWPGFGYGLFWWAVLFIVGPVINMIKPIYKLEIDTILTTISIALFWGCFIGYTISVEFNDESLREPFNNFKLNNRK